MNKIIIAASCFLISLYLLWTGVAGLIEGFGSNSWPTVPGVITISRMERRNLGRGDIKYVADIRYRYAVAGVSYIGTRVDITDRGNSSNKDAVEAYPPGKEVTVYYEQKNHEHAVLEAGVKVAHWLRLGFGLALLVAGGFLAREGLQSFWSEDYERPTGY